MSNKSKRRLSYFVAGAGVSGFVIILAAIWLVMGIEPMLWCMVVGIGALSAMLFMFSDKFHDLFRN